MKAHVEQTGENAITVNVDPKLLESKNQKGKVRENNFNSTELMLSMASALDYDENNSKNTEVQQFTRKFERICASLKETKKDNYGFYGDNYVPYFSELYERKLIEPFSYIVFASSNKAEINNWLATHKADITKFYDWDNQYWETK